VTDFLSQYLPKSQVQTDMKRPDDTIFQDLQAWVESDIFIGAKSQASLVAAILKRGIAVLLDGHHSHLTIV
jgi:hypothetical protein